MIPAIIGSILSTAGGIWMNHENNKNQRAINKANIQYSREQQNLANAYNSPSAQMSRFKQAGLNPNLIYQQGSAGEMQPESVNQVAPTLQNPFANLADTLNTAYHLQTERMKALKDMDIDERNAVVNETRLGFDEQMLPLQKSSLMMQVNKMFSDIGLNSKRAQEIDASIKHFQTQDGLINLQRELAQYQADYEKERKEYNKERAFNELQSIIKNNLKIDSETARNNRDRGSSLYSLIDKYFGSYVEKVLGGDSKSSSKSKDGKDLSIDEVFEILDNQQNSLSSKLNQSIIERLNDLFYNNKRDPYRKGIYKNYYLWHSK